MANARYHDQRVRLAGAVCGDGLACDPGRTGAQFTLLGDSQHVPVVFKGVVPDLFKAECQVVVEGRLDKDGVFRADAMMTKCASKYESGQHGKQQKQEKTS
jgi:cytochrome c-type biogenesis protein CcmE